MTTTKNPHKTKITFCCGLIAATASVTFNCLVADAKPYVMADNITSKEVQTAQQNWCDALVAISEAHAKGGLDVSKPLAAKVIDTAYAYQFGPVAFKPTWAKGEKTFRATRDGAISYFVGDDPDYNDIGFAIGTPGPNRSPWVKCTPEVFVVQSFGNTANSMGWVHVEAADGTRGKVDKTFSYIRDSKGNLRIVVHHSSKPFVSN